MATPLTIASSSGFNARGFIGFDLDLGGLNGNAEFGLNSTGQLDAMLSFKVAF